MLLRGIAILIVFATTLLAGEPPFLNAKLGPPVLQELMGGCSLTCSLPWDAKAGDGQEEKKLTALNDSNADTAWTGARLGDKLAFQFPADLPRELNGTPFYGIDMANGRLNPREEFTAYGRIKTLRLSHNGQPVYLIRLADSPRWQKAEFDDIYLDIGDTLTLEIVEIYPGKQFPTGSLTEIVLQGAH